MTTMNKMTEKAQEALLAAQEHAAEAGLVVPTSQPIDQLLTKFIFSQGQPARKSAQSVQAGMSVTS